MRKLITQLLISAAVAALLVAVVFLHADLRVFVDEAGKEGWNKRVVIPGAAFLGLLLLALLVNVDRVGRWLTTRRALAALNVFVMTILAAATLVFVNATTARRYFIGDWTFRDTYSISQRTRAVLDGMKRKVVAHVFVPPGNPFMSNIRGLLDTYQAAGRGTFEVHYLNPAEDRDAVDRTLLKLGVDPKTLPQPNVVIFEAINPEASVPRTKYVTMQELIEADYSQNPMQPQLKGFKGEELFTKALLDVTRDRQSSVTFLSGHQEFDPYGQPDERVKAFETALRNLNYDVKTFKFDFAPDSKGGDVPEGCDVLVAIGPRSRFDDREIAAIKKYLEGGGRFLLLVDPVLRQRPASTSVYLDDIRVGEIVKDYGIAIDQAVLVEPVGEGTGLEFIARYDERTGDHPITRPMKGMIAVLAQAQAITLAEGGDEPKRKTTRLLETTAAAMSVKNLDALLAGRDPHGVADKKGPFPIAVAVSQERGEGKETRLVVGADATMAADAMAQQVPGHMSFLVNAVGWLAEREETISIDSKPPEILALHLEPGDDTRLYLLGLLDMPLLCAAMALAVWAVRRR